MDEKVYLEKLSAFTRMLRLQGLAVSPQETADGAKLLIALGLALALKSGWALSLLSLTLGIMTITDGLFKVQTSLDAKRFGLQNWWLMLALAVLAGAAGAALIVWPFKGMGTPGWLLGMCLIALGILNLCVALCAVKIIAHQQPDVI